jgi:hypothetical protein
MGNNSGYSGRFMAGLHQFGNLRCQLIGDVIRLGFGWRERFFLFFFLGQAIDRTVGNLEM